MTGQLLMHPEARDAPLVIAGMIHHLEIARVMLVDFLSIPSDQMCKVAKAGSTSSRHFA